jgi:hypothetical protein
MKAEHYYILLSPFAVFVIFAIGLWVRAKIIDYRDSKKFIRELRLMEERHKRDLHRSLEKAFEQVTPQIVEFFRQREAEKNKTKTNE